MGETDMQATQDTGKQISLKWIHRISLFIVIALPILSYMTRDTGTAKMGDPNAPPDFQMVMATVSLCNWNVLLIPFFLAVPILCVVLLASCVAAARRRQFGEAAFGLIVLGVLPFSLVYSVLVSSPWTSWYSLAGPDGKTYAYLGSAIMQNDAIDLGRLDHQGIFYDTYTIVGEASLVLEPKWSFIIRPGGPNVPSHNFLRMGNDNVLYCVHNDYRCYCGYDFATGEFIRGDHILEVSPFVFMATDTLMYKPDLERIRSHMQKVGDPESPGYPRRKALQDGANHPNSEVAKVAVELLVLDEEIQKSRDVSK